MTHRRTRLLAVPAATAALALAASSEAQTPTTLQPQLPDLVQATPSEISVVTQRPGGRKRFRLAFKSAAENRGYGGNGGGDLLVVGHRPNRQQKFMTVDQYVDMFDPRTGQIPTQTVHPNVGRVRFVRSHDHRHWHFLRFESYELHRASDDKRVARDRKTGFCLGNRYQVKAAGTARAAQVSRVSYRDFSPNCGRNRTRLLKVTEGISVGWGDDYKPLLEGQYVDVTKVPSGRYVLVHRANPSETLLESDYTNNASSVLLRLTRHGARKPTMRILARCPGQARCTAG